MTLITSGLHWTRRSRSVHFSEVIGAAPVSPNVGLRVRNTNERAWTSHHMTMLRNMFQILLLAIGLQMPTAIQAQFTFTTNNGAITITSYTGPGGNVAIPSTINGYPVRTLGVNAFDDLATLPGVIIPDSVTSVGD